MSPKQEQTKNKQPGGPGGTAGYLIWYALIGFWISFIISNIFTPPINETIPYSAFLNYVQSGNVEQVTLEKQQITGIVKESNTKPLHFKTVRVEDPELAVRLAAHNIKFEGLVEDTVWKDIASWVAGPIIFFIIWIVFMSAASGQKGMGSGLGLMSIEKSRAKVYAEKDIKVTFADVAGVDEAKEELQEVVSFLKEPQRYTRLGAHLPKGILLVGPPGTGKTLMARAIAGEAGVPFFSISGSEFVEMFVGVGAARVRDLFAEAQKSAPCIVFIDELDALGRARGINPMMGGHDEKEQTLNQLLVEMDGFDPKQGVILIAATNRPEILDQALLRAGRFDRHVLIDRPDKIGRQQILKVHMKNLAVDETLKVDEIAALTPGFTGADLANLVNEAVLVATRAGADKVRATDFTAALERIVGGLEKRNRLLNARERETVAYHEMGHTLVSMSIPGSDPIQKVSIIPRGIGALGYTMQRPLEDRFLMSKQELENKLAILLGGRAAEMITFNEVSTGAADDLSKATEIARNMVMRYGMIKSIGPVAYDAEPQSFLNDYQNSYPTTKRHSEVTAREIDCAIRDLVSMALERAVAILVERRQDLQKAAIHLLDRETLNQADLTQLFAGNQISGELSGESVCNPRSGTEVATAILPVMSDICRVSDRPDSGGRIYESIDCN